MICCFICMGTFQFGYDLSYFSGNDMPSTPCTLLISILITGILAMKLFLKLYGKYNAVTGAFMLTAKMQPLVTSIINVGEFLGAVSSFWIGDKYGRKGGLYVSSTSVVIGVTLQVSDATIGSLIAGRLVLGALISTLWHSLLFADIF